eukprot:2862699-Lingulodinium_polyedra.AAC.1
MWNARLLAILYIGMQSGVWQHFSQTPLWGGPGATLQPQPEAGEEEEDREGAQEAREAASSAVPAAKAAASQASRSTEPKAVARGNEVLADLRKTTKNTLFAAGSALAHEELQTL